MEYEMKLVKEQHERIGLPVRDKSPTRFSPDELSARRRGVRVATDGLIRSGLDGRNITEIAAGIAETMTAAAGTCLQFGLRPNLASALNAARELLEDARLVVDNGLTFSEHDQVDAGVCMLEIVCTGIASCFGIPYKQVIDLAHAAYMQGKDIDREQLQLVIDAATKSPKESANDNDTVL